MLALRPLDVRRQRAARLGAAQLPLVLVRDRLGLQRDERVLVGVVVATAVAGELGRHYFERVAAIDALLNDVDDGEPLAQRVSVRDSDLRQAPPLPHLGAKPPGLSRDVARQRCETWHVKDASRSRSGSRSRGKGSPLRQEVSKEAYLKTMCAMACRTQVPSSRTPSCFDPDRNQVELGYGQGNGP